jgi:peptidoglycan-N-acetylglucosamine deacetylase
MKYLYNPPSLFKKIFPSTHWNTSNNKILLTFDDGPLTGNTEKILTELKNSEIKALFFCVGNNVRERIELTNLILSEGHSIGNHTFNHQRITKFKSDDWEKEVVSVSSLLKSEFNYVVKYFRPPYGRFNLKTKCYLSKLGLQNVMWSLMTYDYKNNLDIVKFAINKYLRRNSIIVLHDNKKCQSIILESIKCIINSVKEKGFEFGVPEECLK